MFCREAKTNPDGTEKVKVSYPKYKNGGASVRSVKIEQNSDYVEELYQFYLSTSKEELASAVEDLKEMTPQPMVSMFDKQPKEAAVQSEVRGREWSQRSSCGTTRGKNRCPDNNKKGKTMQNMQRTTETSQECDQLS
ncbi:PREDICTED: uncharacterized protein LOC107357470 isoform X4 [Acropora digitifera]|uniref:uncharacterized protein LOC107357470 isoform X4 n=1 Tax=Acropora digitifera TaxID=70779 RepID=UPI00077AEAED|nr:PREDICTED: uncharacterized protein LOC107357470 isoform X4 [Acropora digitifera]